MASGPALLDTDQAARRIGAVSERISSVGWYEYGPEP
jgi:hypothetical protein